MGLIGGSHHYHYHYRFTVGLRIGRFELLDCHRWTAGLLIVEESRKDHGYGSYGREGVVLWRVP